MAFTGITKRLHQFVIHLLSRLLPRIADNADQFWCWINSQYNAERLAGEYFWMWSALFASVVMYITLYFWAQGRLSVDEEKWYKFHLKKSDDSLKRPERRRALRLLL
jgi:hypothetical protein